jgi:glyoxylase I family protein
MSCLNRRDLLTLCAAAGGGLLGKRPAEAATAGVQAPAFNAMLGVGGGVHHTAIRTRDWGRTLLFYQTVLGFRIKLAWQEVSGSMDERLNAPTTRPRNQRWAYLDGGQGTCLEIFEDPDFVPPAADATDPTKSYGSPLVHIGLRTTRIEAVFEAAQAFGSAVMDRPADFTLQTTTGQGAIVVRLCFIQGPSGEWIELIQNAP